MGGACDKMQILLPICTLSTKPCRSFVVQNFNSGVKETNRGVRSMNTKNRLVYGTY